MKGKKIKTVAKSAIGHMAKTLGKTTRQALEEELVRYAERRRRGGGLMLKRTQKLKNVPKRS